MNGSPADSCSVRTIVAHAEPTCERRLEPCRPGPRHASRRRGRLRPRTSEPGRLQRPDLVIVAWNLVAPTPESMLAALRSSSGSVRIVVLGIRPELGPRWRPAPTATSAWWTRPTSSCASCSPVGSSATSQGVCHEAADDVSPACSIEKGARAARQPRPPADHISDALGGRLVRRSSSPIAGGAVMSQRRGETQRTSGTAGNAGFTERLARSSATHPWRTVGIWVAIIVVAVLSMGSLLGSGLTSEMKQHGEQPDSAIAQQLIEERMTGERKMTDFVIVPVDDAHGRRSGLQGLRDGPRRQDPGARPQGRRGRLDVLPDRRPDDGLARTSTPPSSPS